MIYYIVFVKLPNVYIKVKAGNRAQALSHITKYRNDGIAYSEDEPKLSFSQAELFKADWVEVHLDYIKANANTKKKFKVTKPDGAVEYFETLQEELEAMLKQAHPKGQFFTVPGGQRFFVEKIKKENIPICAIQEVSRIPKMLTDSKTADIELEPAKEEVKEYKEIQTEIA